MSANKAGNNTSFVRDSSPSKSKSSFFLIAALVLIVVTSALYYKSLNNKLTTWDDDFYITNNADIRTLHGDSIGFTINKTFTSYVAGNYHPLTMLSLCLDYERGKLNPKSYHLTNLILHIINALLVFAFIWLLTKQKWLAFITALLFAIHPMHVESVAWASERKDVLYSLFYLAALCTYIIYYKKENRKPLFYALTFSLFCLAVLSKAMAVSLPLAFIVIDYFLDRKITLKTLLEKAPFFILSIIMGYVAILAQQSSDAVHIDSYNFADRFLFTCYGITMYVWQLFVPTNLSCYYNYPPKVDGVFPAIVYLSPIIVAGFAFLIYKSQRLGKAVVFGFGFFIITLALVLQILPVGGAIIADRYSYLPYIGLFFIIASGINYLIQNPSGKYSNLKVPAIAATVLFVLMCSYLTMQRTKLWKDSLTLWNDAIKNERFNIAPLAYKSRATAYYMSGQYENAVIDYSENIRLIDNNPETYCDRGIALYYSKKYAAAINDFDKTIQLLPQHLRALHFRGLSYFTLKNYNNAVKDFTGAIALKPYYPFGYYSRGLSLYYLGKNEEALKDYNTAIKQNPQYVEAYSNRGLVLYNLQKFEEAIADYSTAIQVNPQYYNAYYNRALAYTQLKKYEESISDYTTTIKFLPNFASAYYFRALDNFALKKYEAALNDALKAKELGQVIDPNFITLLKRK